MTTRTQHTPGPWKQKDDHKTMISATLPKDWKPTPEHPVYIVCQTNMYVTVPHEEAKANASLIAAAPELLEALKDLLGDIPTIDARMDHTCSACGRDMFRGQETCESDDCPRVMARAAIAKAEGRA